MTYRPGLCHQDGPTFEQWMRRPVYVVQCRTFARMLDLIGYAKPAPDRGIATKGAPVWVTFRALPGHRDQYGQILRDMVAVSFRTERLNARIDKQT